MSIDHRSLRQALRTLDEAPKKITQAKRQYSADLEEIRKLEKTGNYSPNYIAKAKADAKEKRDRAVKTLAESMKPALNVVRANNDYSTAELDLNNPKLQTALNIINGQGKNLAHNLQVQILNQFRGDPSSLAVLEGAMKANGLYFHSLAHEMQKSISSEAIDNMNAALNYFDYYASKGIYDFDEKKIYWTQNAFAEQAQRLGYDLEDGTQDAYTFALAELRRQAEQERFGDPNNSAEAWARKMALDMAQNEVTKARESGQDEAEAFNRAVKRIQQKAAEMATEPQA